MVEFSPKPLFVCHLNLQRSKSTMVSCSLFHIWYCHFHTSSFCFFLCCLWLTWSQILCLYWVIFGLFLNLNVGIVLNYCFYCRCFWLWLRRRERGFWGASVPTSFRICQSRDCFFGIVASSDRKRFWIRRKLQETI